MVVRSRNIAHIWQIRAVMLSSIKSKNIYVVLGGICRFKAEINISIYNTSSIVELGTLNCVIFSDNAIISKKK